MQRIMPGVRLFLALLMPLSQPWRPAEAATYTGTLAVTMTVQAACTISATTLAFGVDTGAQLDATSTLTITCTNTTPYNVGLSAGNGNAATVLTREMQGRDSRGVKYALLRDAARTLNWGVTVGTDTVAGTGTGAGVPLTIYGRVPAGQFVAPANYTDTIIATLTF